MNIQKEKGKNSQIDLYSLRKKTTMFPRVKISVGYYNTSLCWRLTVTSAGGWGRAGWTGISNCFNVSGGV